MDVGGGEHRKCVNKTAYHHVATGAAGFPRGVCVCVWANVQNEYVCAALVGGGVRAGVLHGVKFQS